MAGFNVLMFFFCHDTKNSVSYTSAVSILSIDQIVIFYKFVVSQFLQICRLFEIIDLTLIMAGQMTMLRSTCFKMLLVYLFSLNCEMIFVLLLAIYRLLILVAPIK